MSIYLQTYRPRYSRERAFRSDLAGGSEMAESGVHEAQRRWIVESGSRLIFSLSSTGTSKWSRFQDLSEACFLAVSTSTSTTIAAFILYNMCALDFVLFPYSHTMTAIHKFIFSCVIYLRQFFAKLIKSLISRMKARFRQHVMIFSN